MYLREKHLIYKGLNGIITKGGTLYEWVHKCYK